MRRAGKTAIRQVHTLENRVQFAGPQPITFASSPPKPGATDSLVRPMDSSEARYLGLLTLEASDWGYDGNGSPVE